MGELERAEVANMYPGPEWKKKVKAMPDSQVIAIYLKEQKRIKESPPKQKPENPPDDTPF